MEDEIKIDMAMDVAADYGDVLSRCEADVKPKSLLPYDIGVIGGAILFLLTHAEHPRVKSYCSDVEQAGFGDYINSLRVGYVCLGQFVDDADAEIAARESERMAEIAAGVAGAISSYDAVRQDRYRQILEEITAEMKRRQGQLP